MDERAQLLQRIAELEAENAELRRRLASVEHQLQQILQRRKRSTAKRPPKAGTRTGLGTYRKPRRPHHVRRLPGDVIEWLDEEKGIIGTAHAARGPIGPWLAAPVLP